MTTIRADAVSAAQACWAWLVWSGGWTVNQWTKRTGSGVCKAQDMSKRDRGVAIFSLRLFYGCSYRFHLSGDNSRDRYIKG